MGALNEALNTVAALVMVATGRTFENGVPVGCLGRTRDKGARRWFPAAARQSILRCLCGSDTPGTRRLPTSDDECSRVVVRMQICVKRRSSS